MKNMEQCNNNSIPPADSNDADRTKDPQALLDQTARSWARTSTRAGSTVAYSRWKT
jgi:hypothetical protein